MAPNKAPGGPAPRLDPALDTGAMIDAALWVADGEDTEQRHDNHGR